LGSSKLNVPDRFEHSREVFRHHLGVQRVLVIGNSGSGKTTLARSLAGRLGAPHIELDGIFHQAGWTPLDPVEFRRRVDEATSMPCWVVCGNYTVVRDILWDRADTVICFDLPKWLNLWRVMRRTAVRWVRHQELWNGNRETLRNILALHDKDRSILRLAWSTHAKKRAYIRHSVADERWSHITFHVIRRSRDAQRILDGAPAVAASTPSARKSTPET